MVGWWVPRATIPRPPGDVVARETLGQCTEPGSRHPGGVGGGGGVGLGMLSEVPFAV